jgi:hypothetical protein
MPRLLRPPPHAALSAFVSTGDMLPRLPVRTGAFTQLACRRHRFLPRPRTCSRRQRSHIHRLRGGAATASPASARVVRCPPPCDGEDHPAIRYSPLVSATASLAEGEDAQDRLRRISVPHHVLLAENLPPPDLPAPPGAVTTYDLAPNPRPPDPPWNLPRRRRPCPAIAPPGVLPTEQIGTWIVVGCAEFVRCIVRVEVVLPVDRCDAIRSAPSGTVAVADTLSASDLLRQRVFAPLHEQLAHNLPPPCWCQPTVRTRQCKRDTLQATGCVNENTWRGDQHSRVRSVTRALPARQRKQSKFDSFQRRPKIRRANRSCDACRA